MPFQCLAQPMAMPLAVVRSWVEQAVFIMGQTSRCCMVCLMPQSQVSCSFEYSQLSMFNLDRPSCVCNRLRAFQVVQGFSAPAGRYSSALMLRCTLVSRGSSRSLHNSIRGPQQEHPHRGPGNQISDCKSCYHHPPRACTTNNDHYHIPLLDNHFNDFDYDNHGRMI